MVFKRNIHRYTFQYSFPVFKIGTLVVWPAVDLSAKRCTLPFNTFCQAVYSNFAQFVDISTKFVQFGSIWLVVRNVRIQRRVLWYFAGTLRPSISTTLPRSRLIRYVLKKLSVIIVFLVNDGLFEHFLMKISRLSRNKRENENIKILFWPHVNVLFRTCYRVYSNVKFKAFSFFYKK